MSKLKKMDKINSVLNLMENESVTILGLLSTIMVSRFTSGGCLEVYHGVNVY